MRQLRVSYGVVVVFFGIWCSSLDSSGASRPQVMGDVAIQFEGYSQREGSGWSAVILVTNVSNVKIQCVATSYAAGLPQGSEAVLAKDLKTEELPKRLNWSQGKPQTSIEPRMLQRYGLGQVFDLGPGEGRRLVLPLYVPKAHPHDFVEHLVVGSKRNSAGTGGFDTYIAEVKRS